MEQDTHIKLSSAIKECDAHLFRIQRILKALQAMFPLSVEKFQHLDEEGIGKIDQFIYRFTKLQDAMGLRLFPTLYRILEEDPNPKPFLDILNRLEKLGVVSRVEVWQEFRALRNNLAHEYPESIQQTVETLNALFERWPVMESMYLQAKRVAERL
jgi:hypothetical protein